MSSDYVGKYLELNPRVLEVSVGSDLGYRTSQDFKQYFNTVLGESDMTQCKTGRLEPFVPTAPVLSHFSATCT